MALPIIDDGGSLSPALEFVDQAAAVACAKECLTLLLAPPKEEQPVQAQPSRRELFGFLRPP